DSDSIVTFLVDETRGILEPTGTAVRCGSPVCLVFSP
ncbi:MAG TPA: hemagglutinin, partial [Pseudomonas sp.]|nr:hemagglutinin [Pseudomonas sp.]